MAGKKILYIHGFASSGQTGTVRTLRTLLPSCTVVAPDVPVEPSEALPMLKTLCQSESPDLIIGASMGGMYAEQLRGYDRILVNPAFALADTLLKNNGLGRQEFHNPRQDGATSFLVTKGLLEAFREVSSHCFEGVGEVNAAYPSEGEWSEEQGRVWGLFGKHDPLVDTYSSFAAHYPNAIRYDGEHYLNDKAVLYSLLPLIARVDFAQEGRVRKSIFISLEDTLADVRHLASGEPVRAAMPENSAVKAFRHLGERYDVWILASAPYNMPSRWQDAVLWADEHIGVPAWNKVLVSNRKDLVLGDYLIDKYPRRYGNGDFMGTFIQYGSDTFKTWEDILGFFDRLGGQ
ncbi:MAG: esterase [Bacteroidales bacterium]|nr:esterase [Bacteroidales bacterium]